jgi:hypothetical protein
MKTFVPPKHQHPLTILQTPKSQNVNTCHKSLKMYAMMQKGSFMTLLLKELTALVLNRNQVRKWQEY